MTFLRKVTLQKNCNQSYSFKIFIGLIKMTLGLVHVSCSLPEWQAVKLTFFSPLSRGNFLEFSPLMFLNKMSKRRKNWGKTWMNILPIQDYTVEDYWRPLINSKASTTTGTRFFSTLNSSRAWASVILAGKRDSRRHCTTSFRESVVVAEASHQMLEVLSFCNRERA